jgi:hypothetical protein
VTEAPTPIEIAQSIVGQARMNLETEGHLMPLVFLIDSDGQMDMSSGGAKDMSALAVRLLAAQMDAVASIFISEVWMLFDQTAKHAHLEDIAPSEHPDRQEGFMITVETRTQGRWLCTTPLFEQDGKKTFGAVEFENISDADHAGRFIGIIPQESEAA